MIWSDYGIVISSRRHGEKYKIVNLFTRAHGKTSGMITISRNTPLSPFSCVQVDFRTKVEGSLGFWKIKSEKQNWILSINNNVSVVVSQSICFILEKVLPLGVCYKDLFGFIDFFALNMHEFSTIEVLNLYAYFEFLLLSRVGYGFDMETCSICGRNEEIHYISPRTGRGASSNCIPPIYFEKLFKVPESWEGWRNNDFSNLDRGAIRNSLDITGHFIEKNIMRNENYFRDSVVKMLAA